MADGLRGDLQRYTSSKAREERLRRRRSAFIKQLSERPLTQAPKKGGGHFDLVPDVVELAGSQIADALIHTIPGIVEMGKAVGADFIDLAARHDKTPERSAALLKASLLGIKEDFRHPGRYPGYLLLDLLSLGTGGAGAVARAGRAARTFQAYRAGRAVPVFERKPLPVGNRAKKEPPPEPGAPDTVEPTDPDQPRGPKFKSKKDVKFQPTVEFTNAVQRAVAGGRRSREDIEFRGKIADVQLDDGSVVEVHKSRPGEYQATHFVNGTQTKIADAERLDDIMDIGRDNAFYLQKKHERSSGIQPPGLTEWDDVRKKWKSPEQMQIEAQESVMLDRMAAEADQAAGRAPKEGRHLEDLDLEVVRQGLLEEGGKFNVKVLKEKYGLSGAQALELRGKMMEAGLISKTGAVKVPKKAKAAAAEPAVTDIERLAADQEIADLQLRAKELEKEAEAYKDTDPDTHMDILADASAIYDEIDTLKKGRDKAIQNRELLAAHIREENLTPGGKPHPKEEPPEPVKAPWETQAQYEDRLSAWERGAPEEELGGLPDTARKVTAGEATASRARPREQGTSQRAQATNPRALGINPRALEEAGIPKHMQSPLRKDLKTALTGDKPATPQKLASIFRKHLGPEAGKAAYQKWRNREMGPLFVGDEGPPAQLSDVFKQLAKRPKGGSYLLTIAKRRRAVKEENRRLLAYQRGGITQQERTELLRNRDYRPGKKNEVLPVEVTESNSALIRALQRGRFRIMHIRPDAFEHKTFQVGAIMLQKALRADDKAMERRIKFELTKLDRIRDAAERANLMSRMTETELANFIAGEKAKQRARQVGPGQYFDTVNQLAVILALYLKPAYLSANLLGQAFLVTADHYLNPVAMYRSFHLSKQMNKQFPHLMTEIKASMHEGILESFGLQGGKSTKISAIHGKMARMYNKILDTPFRDATFFNEAIRRGYTSPEMIADLIRNPKKRGEFLQIAMRANENIIDYGRMGKFERQAVRRVIFFYPWIKGASVYSGRFITEHPGQFEAQMQAGRIAQSEIEEELGPLPSYVVGSFIGPDIDIPGYGNLSYREGPNGEKIPRIVNPAAVTVLGTLGEVTGAARGYLAGNPKDAEQLSEYLTPGISMGISSVLKYDPFTGRSYPSDMTGPEIFAQELKQLAAPVDTFNDIRRAQQYASGEKSTEEVLFPYTAKERLGRFIFGVAPYSINKKESRSRAFAERRGLANKTTRERMKAADERRELLEGAISAGMLPRNAKTLPKEVRSALLLKAKRADNLVRYEQELGRKLETIDRLQADLSLAVRMKRIPEQMAANILKEVELAPDSTVEYIYRRIREAMFGGQVISAYRKRINAARNAAGEEQIR